jgi:hypothetical protein
MLPATTVQRRIEIDNQCQQVAQSQIADAPGRLIKGMPVRAARMWFSSHIDSVRNEARGIPRVVRVGVALMLGGIVCLSAVGFCMSLRGYGATLLPMAGLIVFITLAHAPLGSGGRYAAPAWPCVLCLASFAAAKCLCFLRSRATLGGGKAA